MKMLAENFLNPSSGNMAAFAHIANARDPITSVRPVLDQGFTNVRNANGNLQSPPELRCTAPSLLYGSGSLSFFESSGFQQTNKFINDARKELTTNNNPDGCIRASVSSLESTLKTIHDRLGKAYSKKEQLTDLWNSVKNELKLADVNYVQQMMQMLGSLTGSVNALASLRNSLSDAHGKCDISQEVYEGYGELAINLSATLSTFLIRRFIETNDKKES